MRYVSTFALATAVGHLHELSGDISTTLDRGDKIVEMINELSRLKRYAAKNAITHQIMEMADPNKQLFKQKAALESFQSAKKPADINRLALEGIGERIKDAAKAFVQWVKDMVAKISEFVGQMFDVGKRKKAALEKMKIEVEKNRSKEWSTELNDKELKLLDLEHCRKIRLHNTELLKTLRNQQQPRASIVLNIETDPVTNKPVLHGVKPEFVMSKSTPNKSGYTGMPNLVESFIIASDTIKAVENIRDLRKEAAAELHEVQHALGKNALTHLLTTEIRNRMKSLFRLAHASYKLVRLTTDTTINLSQAFISQPEKA